MINSKTSGPFHNTSTAPPPNQPPTTSCSPTPFKTPSRARRHLLEPPSLQRLARRDRPRAAERPLGALAAAWRRRRLRGRWVGGCLWVGGRARCGDGELLPGSAVHGLPYGARLALCFDGSLHWFLLRLVQAAPAWRRALLSRAPTWQKSPPLHFGTATRQTALLLCFSGHKAQCCPGAACHGVATRPPVCLVAGLPANMQLIGNKLATNPPAHPPPASIPQACRRRSGCGAVTFVPYTYRCYLKQQAASYYRQERAGVQTIVVTNCPSPPPPPRWGPCLPRLLCSWLLGEGCT